MVIKARVRRNAYFDSITLMKIARNLTAIQGIEDAAAIMATPPNLALLTEAGLMPDEGINAGPGDVLFVVRAEDEGGAETALRDAEEQLERRPATLTEDASGAQLPLRSVEEAARLHPEAGIAAISVPGPYAALETRQALGAGLHVFLFSDNVALEDEVALKKMANTCGLLLMGPDCGTAMLNGAGLGFVNVVPRGSIGIVGASGTGIQQVMSLIAQGGGGISQIIGCGGRDLTETVGAVTTLQGLRLLQEDEHTQVIVLISKPPASAIAERVLQAATASNKPVVVIFVGADYDALRQRFGNTLTITRTLTEAAQQALLLLEGPDTFTGDPRAGHPQGASLHLAGQDVGTPLVGVRPVGLRPVGLRRDGLRPVGVRQLDATTLHLSALFSGGTLCDEAMHIWTQWIGPVYSNIPLNPAWRLPEDERVAGHCAIDFGADEYTRGRPHPMIDPAARLKRLREDASNPRIGVILLDVVLGYCSHPDPASIYAPVIRAAREQAANEGRQLAFVISLCGTEGDPQRLSAQAAQLRDAGAEVFTSNADAALRCIELL